MIYLIFLIYLIFNFGFLFQKISHSFNNGISNIKKIGKRILPALAGYDDITFLYCEAGRNVNGDVLMSFFESFVFWDEVEVISSDDDGVVHFGGDDHTPFLFKIFNLL